MRRVLLFVSAAMLVAGPAADAHHSYSATYDTGRQITLEGKLVQFVFKNPHSFITVQAPDEHGVLQRWSVEWNGSGQLTNHGVTRETLKPGDEVVLMGNPSRVRGEYKVRMVSLRRPLDGFTWGDRAGQAVD
ncbi:MAG: hypothetical protein HYY76_05695 [Acidobacteria bacterium]|nr:hypothetical protein [Acidobacteriota bacterium]